MARALVLHTPGPYDEVSLTAPACAVLVEGHERRSLELAPEAFGVQAIRPESLAGSDAIGNARRILDVFNGERGPLGDAICANAACALFVAGHAADLREGFERARAAVERGQALRKLHEVQTFIPQEEPHVLAG